MNINTLTGARVVIEIRREMSRFGITEARLRRHCWQSSKITRARVCEVLAGNPGWAREFNSAILADWIELVRTAWLTE